MSRIHRLVLPLRFPHGLHPGAGKDLNNRLVISRDGQGRPVLRGTALAGALRHAYQVNHNADAVEQHFGDLKIGTDGGVPSRLQVADVVLHPGPAPVITRHHNSLDRHSGAVRDGALFDVEALAPGTTGTAVLVYRDDGGDEGAASGLLSALVASLKAGMTLGGKSARGIGDVELADDETRYRCFDLTNLDEHAHWLDEQYLWRGGTLPVDGDPLPATKEQQTEVLLVDLTLAIPRGQDLLVADGQGVDHEMEPQRCRGADGEDRWRLPGSSLRGVLRAWMSRLAAREGLTVDDRVERYLDGRRGSGDDIAWGFDNGDHKRQDLPGCPIMNLFGSAVAKGRIHISDGYCLVTEGQEQVRMHVAVDRITGGASDGFLFDNTVLCGAVRFPIRIRIQQPQDHEVRWLAQSLKALDLGLIRVGSSKAVGVFSVRGLSTSGWKHEFEALMGQEVEA